MKQVLFIVAILMLSLHPAHAHHPNEGSLTLDDLVSEAHANNLQIKKVENNFQSIQAETQSKKGAFLPEVSVEGGPLNTKFDDTTSSGNVVYGKAEWNLYRGGKDRANFEKTKIASEFTQKQFEQSKIHIGRAVAKVYYEMLFILESISLKEKAIEINQEQMKLARAKKSSGYTSESDVIEFELREATLRSDLKLLNQEREEKSRELALVIGRKTPEKDLSVKGHLNREDLGLDKAKILASLDGSNLEILQARAEYQMSEKDRYLTRSGFLPKVDLEARYGKLAAEDKIFSDNNNYSVFLKVSIPLFSGFETLNEHRASVFTASAKEFALTEKNRSITTEVENLFSQIDVILERLSLEEKNLSRSEDYYKLTLGEYRRGVKNSPDMVVAAERLLDAKIRNLEFRKDFYLTRLRLLDVSGQDTL